MDEPLRDRDDVRAWLAEHAYGPDDGAPVTGRVGLEIEFFPFWVARTGAPAARLALVEVIGIVDGIDGAEREPGSADGRPSWRLHGALITEEPGAQVEVAGPPEPDAATAIRGAERVIDDLRDAFHASGAALASCGLDLWSAPGEVPVQLGIPRYEAMSTYFERRGIPDGHILMCASCSIQVNVDLGPPAIAPRRWLLANLAAPVFTAAFASSPVEGAVNGRALRWRRLDPTRTGVPPPLLAGVDDPVEHVLDDALRADVLLVERDGDLHAGRPGWTFDDWLTLGHPEFGRPIGRDLRNHLTTLFPEARLRGFLEVRSIDQLPRPLRAAAITLVVGLLYDPEATERALAALEPHRAGLRDLLERATRDGLADDEVAGITIAVLGAALDGARRLAIPYAAAADDYLGRFTERRLHPSDDVRGLLRRDRIEAFRWASADAPL